MIKDKNQSWKSFAFETILLIGVVLFIRFYVFQFFQVSGPSMCLTLNMIDGACESEKGEFLFVNEFLYHFLRAPQRGEVVVFHPPYKKIYYIKRIIGVPGDIVEIKNGEVFVSRGEVIQFALPEFYLSDFNRGNTQSFYQTKFVVPEDHFLLMGDNRAKSFDARQCYNPSGCDGVHTPFVPRKNIKGRAEFVVWPISLIRKIENPFQTDPLSSASSF